MRELILNGADWATRDDVYDAFFRAVGAPEWHGRNLDALADSIRGGSIIRWKCRIDWLLKATKALVLTQSQWPTVSSPWFTNSPQRAVLWRFASNSMSEMPFHEKA